MKILARIAVLLSVLVTGLAGCKENDQLFPIDDKSNKFRLIAEVPGELNGDSIVYAIVSIQNGSNQEVISNKKIALNRNSNTLTAELELPSGSYRVTKFIVVNVDNISSYATPVSNSEKAGLVQKPLAIGFSLPNPSVLQIHLDVLKIQVNDDDDSFGYPENTFTRAPVQSPGVLRIKVKAQISVGDIIYDNIPAAFSIISRDAAGQLHVKDTLLAAGANEITLPESHVEFQLKMAKWGISDEISLSRAEISEDTVYILGGNKAAKMLRREEKFIFAAGSYRPSSKTVYTYHPNNNLKQMVFYQKLPEHADLRITGSRTYLYSGNNVSRTSRLDKDGIETGYTSFTYNPQQNRVISIYEKSYDQETAATIRYTSATGGTLITMNYQFDNGRTMEYRMKISQGNKVEDQAGASNGGEAGTYIYDSNINPFVHMNVPDLYLSNISKNNLIHRQKNFSGNIPGSEPYKYEYVYDAEGYPEELVTSFKNYLTGEHLFKIKTIYYYN